MPTLHPSSAGLRQLADFLDSCAEEGIDVNPLSYVFFNNPYGATKESQVSVCAALSKRLPSSIKMDDPSMPYATAEITHEFSGVCATFRFSADALCEQVTEMREVKVWKCGGVEVTK